MKTTKICMNAMVKNEANTITRMLESCAPYIDYWVVQDNGSTDGTQDIIRNFFAEKNIPGFLYETDWQYPGWNRDHTIQQALSADHGCDWILRMDADEQLIVSEDFDWSILNDTSVTSWNIPADAGDSMYFRTWMWNSKLPWFFAHDKRHECIHLPNVGENFQRVPLPIGFKQLITNDGMTWFKPMKFLNDALELELDKVVSNKVLEDNYHLWYIGKSYSDSYGDSTQFPFGIHHSREYARRAIFYFEMYLNQTHDWYNNQSKQPKFIDDMGFYALHLIGKAYAFLGEYNKSIQHYEYAHTFNPDRNENILDIVELYERLGENEKALSWCMAGLSESRTNPFPKWSFMIENKAYWNTGTYVKDLKTRLESKVKQQYAEPAV